MLLYFQGGALTRQTVPSEGSFDAWAKPFVEAGIDVVIADYVGFGITAAHFPSYFQKEEAGMLTVQAFEHFGISHLGFSLFIAGYSLGAYNAAVVCERQLLSAYAPHYFIGGAILDVERQLAWLLQQTEYIAPANVVLLLFSLLGKADMLRLIAPTYHACIETHLFAYELDLLNALLPKKVAVLFTNSDAVLKHRALRAALRHNSVFIQPSSSVHIFHSHRDPVCFIENLPFSVKHGSIRTIHEPNHIEASHIFFNELLQSIRRL